MVFQQTRLHRVGQIWRSRTVTHHQAQFVLKSLKELAARTDTFVMWSHMTHAVVF